MSTPGRPATLVDVLEALDGRTDVGARFVNRGGEATFHSCGDVLTRARAAAAFYQARGIRPGDRIAIVLPTGIGFFDAFLGAVLAGAVPAAVYPPLRLGKLDEYSERTTRMLETIGPRLVVSDGRVLRVFGTIVPRVASIDDVVSAGDLTAHAATWRRPEVEPSATAFLQFSSGTTVEPKAVVLSHANVIANLEMIDATFFRDATDEEVRAGGVCWLPLYHDMGLLGCMLEGLYHPGTVTYIGPEQFIARPAIWLQTLSRYRAITSPAPDFAYGLCAAKVKDEEMDGVDLSRWRVALNGAEPIDIETIRRFTERFARWGFRAEAMTPVYGLAEAGLAVSYSAPQHAPRVVEFDRDALSERGVAAAGRGRPLASVGRPMPGLSIEIRDEAGAPLRDGRVGIVHVRGASITSGYFNNHELTRRTIRGGWLDTGDLGFMHAGELFISGRHKDLIIIRGRNYAPQEIEQVFASAEGLRTGCAVALGHQVDGAGEQLVVLAERDIRTRRADVDLAADIRDRIIAGIGLTPYDVLVLAPGTLPRTSSGKLRRAAALQAYAGGTLQAPRDVGALQLLGEMGRSAMALGRFRFQKRRRAERDPAATD